jgi:hypothetical protein
MTKESEPEPQRLGIPDLVARVRPALTRPQDVALPPPLGRPIDGLAALLEERQGER